MICEFKVKKFCKDDLSLIENYDKAIADTTQVWHCHHRLETDENLSGKELIARNMYYNRPASELIFLTPFEHYNLHFKDKPRSEETKAKIRLNHADVNGENNPMYGKKAWNSGKTNVYSEETRKKISKGMREVWKRRKEKSL